MSSVLLKELSLSQSGARRSIEIQESRAHAKLVVLGAHIASNRRYDQQKNHQYECRDQQCKSGHVDIA